MPVRLAGEELKKWVNGFRLKPYLGPTPSNLFPNNHRKNSVEAGMAESQQNKGMAEVASIEKEESRHRLTKISGSGKDGGRKVMDEAIIAEKVRNESIWGGLLPTEAERAIF